MFIQLLPGKYVLWLVMDCKLARTDSKSGRCSTKHFGSFAALYHTVIKCTSHYRSCGGILRTIKVALTLLLVTRKYARILQQFTETEWLPSVDFLTLSSLF